MVFAQDTGFQIESDPDTVRAPDAAFLASARAERIHDRGYARVAPDLVVEVLSPDDRPGEVSAKVADWLAAGVRLIWVIDPRRRAADVHHPDGRIASGETRLDGEDVLSGFTCAVDDLLL